jgi:hypothetical protein
MSSLVPHPRHNQHHTLFLAQEQPYSQSNLHLHDQQPLNYKIFTIIHSSSKDTILSFTTLQHASL